MAQEDLEKFQTPATAFQGENGPVGPKTPKSGTFCGGFGTNGGQKCVILGFWGLETIQNYSRSVLVENNFFEKNCFFHVIFGPFWGLLGPKWGVQGANFVVLGPENHLGCVFEQKKFF